MLFMCVCMFVCLFVGSVRVVVDSGGQFTLRVHRLGQFQYFILLDICAVSSN